MKKTSETKWKIFKKTLKRMERKFQWNTKTQLYGLLSKGGAQTNWGPKVLKGKKILNSFTRHI
jgi:hypothetical protein